jgi:hypothetical protein
MECSDNPVCWQCKKWGKKCMGVMTDMIPDDFCCKQFEELDEEKLSNYIDRDYFK